MQPKKILRETRDSPGDSHLRGRKGSFGKTYTVAIRTDGDHELGLGHVYRSTNLAEELRRNGFRVVFMTESPGLRGIIPRHFEIKKIIPKNIQKTVDRISPRIIVIDKLGIGSGELRILLERADVVAIDYTGNNKKMLKNGINILYHKTGVQGRNSVSGFEFTIMNESVRRRKPVRITKKVANILVLQGGTDTHCNIPDIVELLDGIDSRIQINVVVGAAFKCWKKLDAAANKSRHKVKTFHNVKDIGRVMVKNDMAITGGGMSSLELCHLGIPSVIICGEPFENETASMLERGGFGANMGHRKPFSKRKVLASIRALMADYHRRVDMNRARKILVDGNGTKRVADRIMGMIK